MRKRLILIGIILFLILVTIALLTLRKSTSQVKITKVKVYQKPEEEALSLYNKAEEFVKEDNLLEAKKTYKKLLEEHTGSGLIKDVRARLDELNMKLLFSQTPTEDSTFYEVVPGDTLHKIANNFGTTVELIMKSNNLTSTVIKPGMRLKVSNAKYSIIVDKSQNILILKADDEVLKTYTVSTGEENSTPTGTYKIENKLVDPTWYKTGAVVPPDSPENILGCRWIGLNLPGYGIHGTTDEPSIGKHITAGCVRMRNKDVEEIYSIVTVGTEVTIID